MVRLAKLALRKRMALIVGRKRLGGKLLADSGISNGIRLVVLGLGVLMLRALGLMTLGVPTGVPVTGRLLAGMQSRLTKPANVFLGVPTHLAMPKPRVKSVPLMLGMIGLGIRGLV